MQDIDEKLLKKIRALLETRGCSEAEAQARVAKAQELLERHGLEIANLNQTGAARKDTKRLGGLYTWQRNLWNGVAKLNFCAYFFIRGLDRGAKYEHRLVGSHANVVSTELMAAYLQDTIEQHAAQWAKDRGYHSRFVREAIAFRDGMTDRIVERLAVRRREQVSAARKEAEAAKAAAHQQAFGDAQTARALTILDVISTEEDFNNDYLNHWEMGTTARNRAEAEARQKAWEEEYRRREAAKSPEQKAAEAEQLRKDAKEWEKQYAKRQKRINQTPPKERPRAQTAEEKRRGMGSYYTGRAAGDKVGIDKQATDNSQKPAIR